MSGEVLQLESVIVEDHLGCSIAEKFLTWDNSKSILKERWKEIREYVYATDTTQTSNHTLPWKNTTTIPKLCQIRDNLFANYMATMFPKRKWMKWIPDTQDDAKLEKTQVITNYMAWVVEQPWFKPEIEKLVLDYIDYGNCFSTIEWQDDRVMLEDRTQVGYVGPKIKRISPMDIVFNPHAGSFEESPKIIRTIISLGEMEEVLQRLTNTPEDIKIAEETIAYLKKYRVMLYDSTMEWESGDIYNMEAYGYSNYKTYAQSGDIELLYFYGDIYNPHTDEFLKNYMIVVADRHKVVYKAPNPSFFGRPPIFHSGWRRRQDSLWAMGPLENIVGMQYRLDHTENAKADLFDLTVVPPLKLKGHVEDFVWGPMAKVVTDADGDVDLLTPQTNMLSIADSQLAMYLQLMEEMAGAPKEAMGFRTPGEKTAFEVQRLENAASRIFTNKIAQFEEQQIEPCLNACLELARRNMDTAVVPVLIDEELGVVQFRNLTSRDITGQGRIRPVAARHFAETSTKVQNITQMSNTPIWQQISAHISSVKLSALVEDLLDLGDYDLITPYVAISEQAELQRIGMAAEQDVMVEAQTPAGVSQGDF